MAYPCPHCDSPVRRASSSTSWEQGLMGIVLAAAMSDFECPRCGIITREEFAPEVQQQMSRGTWGLLAVVGVLAAGVSFYLAFHALR
jgi:predicted RNA-binding Zn-ribbon protein involved in translation (DUF1610 family)